MKITLILPARQDDFGKIGQASMSPPVGITRLAGLVPEGTEVKLVDMLSNDKVDYKESVDLVGLTVRTPTAAAAYQIADRFRSKGVPVVLGGPHASVVPLDAAQHADAVVVGEAETTWPRLLEDFKDGNLKQYYVCGPLKFDPGDSTLYHEAEFPSLNGLPIPRNELLPEGRRYIMDTVFTTRGCPFDCSFCPVSNLFGRGLRHRPVEEVVEEVALMKNRIYFNVDDNAFGVPGDEEYYLELFSELSKMKNRKSWTGLSGLGVVETPAGREIVKLAVKSGMTSAMVGLESISEEGLAQSNAARKHSGNSDPTDIEKIVNALNILREYGLFIYGWFIIGWDGDTKETYKSTIEFSKRAGIAPVLSNLYPLPGTHCYDDFVKSGKMKPDLTWADFTFDGSNILYYHPNLSEQEMVTTLRTCMRQAYSLPLMLKRSIDFTIRRPRPTSFPMAMMMQKAVMKIF